MDNNTRGLKLMTVFIVVLVAHVLVLGTITTYYLLKSPTVDTVDKTIKLPKTDGALASDGTMPEGAPATPPALNPPAEGAGATPAPASSIASDPTPWSGGSATVPSGNSAVLTSQAPVDPPSVLNQIPLRTGPAGPVINPTSPLAGVAPPVDPAPIASTPASVPPISPELVPPADNAPASYVVKPHDSLAKIAHTNHITVANLRSANSLKSDMLQIGQKLVIPAKAPAPVVATTTTAPDSSMSAAIYPDGTSAAPAGSDVPTGKVPAKTPARDVAKTTTGAAPDKTVAVATASHQHLYTVVKGDTLTKIAHMFKTTPKVLMAENSIPDATKLSIGKKLVIPSKETRSAKVTEPVVAQPAQVQPKPAATISVATTAPAPVKTTVAAPAPVAPKHLQASMTTLSAPSQPQEETSTVSVVPPASASGKTGSGEYASNVP